MRKSNKKWAEAFREVFPILLLKKKLKKNEIGEKLKKLSIFMLFSQYQGFKFSLFTLSLSLSPF